LSFSRQPPWHTWLSSSSLFSLVRSKQSNKNISVDSKIPGEVVLVLLLPISFLLVTRTNPLRFYVQVGMAILVLTILVYGTSGIPQDSFMTILLLCGMFGVPTSRLTRILAVD